MTFRIVVYICIGDFDPFRAKICTFFKRWALFLRSFSRQNYDHKKVIRGQTWVKILKKRVDSDLFGTIVYNIHMFRLRSYFFRFLDFGLGWAERTFHRIREKNNGSIVNSWFIRRIVSEVAK